MNIKEYGLGWGWLLPLTEESRVHLVGFDDSEWRDESDSKPAEFVRDPYRAEGLMIDAERAGFDWAGVIASIMAGSIRWVAVIGTGRSVSRWRRLLAKGFQTIREYGLLPASSPRVVAPLGNPQHTVIALGLHRPGRWFARSALQFAKAAAQMGVFFPLRGKVLLIATRQRQMWPSGAIQAEAPAHLPEEIWDYALYLGAPDDNRKTTVLPLGASAPDMLIKIGSSPEARRALKNEADALTLLSKSALKDHTPKLKKLVENEHGTALYQEYRSRLRRNSQAMELAVADFLARLSTLDRRCRPLRDALADLPAANPHAEKDANQRALFPVLRWLEAQADAGAEVWEHRSHGDFAPWNCSWTERGFFVFDWESSSSCGLAFADAFYFVAAPAVHVSRSKSPESVALRAIKLAQEVSSKSGLCANNIKIYLALWLLRQVSLTGIPLYRRMLNQLALEGS